MAIAERAVAITGPLGNLSGILHFDAQELERPLLIMAHGFRGSMEGGGRAVYLARQAAQYMDVLRFNFTQGQILSVQVEEVQRVLAYAENILQYKKLILLGRSLGGMAVLAAGSGNACVAALVLWATPHDLRQTFYCALGGALYERLDSGEIVEITDERGYIVLTPEFLTDFDEYNSSSLLQQWRGKPLLFIHGEADETVNVSQARQNYAAAGEPKELIILSGADHSFTEHGQEAAAEVVKWLKKILTII